MTPYYEDDAVTIYHGDCREVLPAMSGVDLIVTSPPYNLGAAPWPHLGHWKQGDSTGGKSKWRNGSDGSAGVTYDGHEDSMPWGEYVAWQHEVWRLMWATLSNAGAIFYNHKTRVIGGRLWKPDELIPADLPLRQELIWARAGGMNFNPTAYLPTHERILIVAKEAWRLTSKGASGVGDVWRVPQEPSEHPAPFPIGIPARAIETTGPCLVLDPFMGSGTTLRAAKDAGVRSVGVEVSEVYCEIAAKRMGQGVLDFGPAA
jgi:site-specific DNA-methyltransferase (adenine-specific)